jgi:hypothetical protein
MISKLTKILVLSACVALAVALSGPTAMTAQEGDEAVTMVHCRCSSVDSIMELAFPADGGQVQGTFLSSYIRDGTSLLYNQDASSDYYEERRAVDVGIHFSGSFSGGKSGAFSGFRATGSATVAIDNRNDDRFDRSYSAELDTPVTIALNADGTITVGGFGDGFTLVGSDANEIPNAEWLDPPTGVIPDDLTLTCTTRSQAQNPAEASCQITAAPDQIGAQDTVFQASVSATGFADGKQLSYGWTLVDASGSSHAAATGRNAAISAPQAGFPPGFYTLTAVVTDGEYQARCQKHWSIGAEQNKPPGCGSVDIVPAFPSVGATSLQVWVQAQDDDGDSLSYESSLMQGMSLVGGSQPAVAAHHTIQILGKLGLQPGGYAVVVSVHDGKQGVDCVKNFVVSQQVSPTMELPAARAPGEPRVGAPTGPPQPPAPPPVAPTPPVPPTTPLASGECGTVQLVYLDDLGIDARQAEIDAFVEKALAEGGPDYSLIVSHRQGLIDRLGEQGFAQVDGLLRSLGGLAETCPFVLIVGDHDVVPFAVIPNPANDGDVLFTDDVYGDNDHDSLGVPDIPVARIPDGYSLDLLVTQLSPSALPASGDFTLANSKRPYVDWVTNQVFGSERSLLWSLPATHGELDPSGINVRYRYFMLHGGSWDTSVWWGEEDLYPEAFTVAEASSQGIVLSGACYGAYTFNRTPENSITLAFLASGARAFVGSTAMTWSAPSDPMRMGGLFEYSFWDGLVGGQPPLAAFMEAKSKLADFVGTGSATAEDLKTLHEFVYYGKP